MIVFFSVLVEEQQQLKPMSDKFSPPRKSKSTSALKVITPTVDFIKDLDDDSDNSDDEQQQQQQQQQQHGGGDDDSVFEANKVTITINGNSPPAKPARKSVKFGGGIPPQPARSPLPRRNTVAVLDLSPPNNGIPMSLQKQLRRDDEAAVKPCAEIHPDNQDDDDDQQVELRRRPSSPTNSGVSQPRRGSTNRPFILTPYISIQQRRDEVSKSLVFHARSGQQQQQVELRRRPFASSSSCSPTNSRVSPALRRASSSGIILTVNSIPVQQQQHHRRQQQQQQQERKQQQQHRFVSTTFLSSSSSPTTTSSSSSSSSSSNFDFRSPISNNNYFPQQQQHKFLTTSNPYSSQYFYPNNNNYSNVNPNYTSMPYSANNNRQTFIQQRYHHQQQQQRHHHHHHMRVHPMMTPEVSSFTPWPLRPDPYHDGHGHFPVARNNRNRVGRAVSMRRISTAGPPQPTSKPEALLRRPSMNGVWESGRNRTGVSFVNQTKNVKLMMITNNDYYDKQSQFVSGEMIARWRSPVIAYFFSFPLLKKHVSTLYMSSITALKYHFSMHASITVTLTLTLHCDIQNTLQWTPLNSATFVKETPPVIRA